LRGDHARDVVLGDVGDFVGHHAGQLGFALCGKQQTGVHADVAARHGEGVDAGIVDDEEIEFALVARADRDQLVAELVEIGFDFGVVQIARVGIDVAHDGPSHRLFFLVGKVLPRHLAQIGQVGGHHRLDGQSKCEQGAQHQRISVVASNNIWFRIRKFSTRFPT